MKFKLREPFNAISHLMGATAAGIGLIVLILTGWAGLQKNISLLIYGISLIAMFLASAGYHSVNARPERLKTLRKVDHAAIFLLIAGTYTPFCLIAFTGFFRWGLLALIWALALTGILIKVRTVRAPRGLNAGIYIVMGWLCVTAAPQMGKVLPGDVLAWLLIGGVVYTLGAVIYATRIFDFVPGKFGFHEIWHIFVLLGAMAHYVAVFRLIG